MTDTTDTETADVPTFYRLPAHAIVKGMSTADCQDVVAVTPGDDGQVLVEIYTPRSDDFVQDQRNFGEPATRTYRADETVAMATFSDTEVDGSSHALAST